MKTNTGRGHFWVIILAAGDGKRVSAMTTDRHGAPTPKQFFAPAGRESMLHSTIRRAERFVPRERIVVVVAEQHRVWWEQALDDFPPDNVVSQPRNRGTAPGILLPFLEVLSRDAAARVLVMPSDHHIDEEDVLGEAVLEAIQSAQRSTQKVILLGMVPHEADRDYGWIVPADRAAGVPAREVAVFVEKPEPARANRLMRRGGMWNSLIFVADASALLRLFEITVPWLVPELLHLQGSDAAAVESVYHTLPTCDFSRDVLERSCESLLVVPVGPCGWSDLGTPARLKRFWAEAERPARSPAGRSQLLEVDATSCCETAIMRTRRSG